MAKPILVNTDVDKLYMDGVIHTARGRKIQVHVPLRCMGKNANWDYGTDGYYVYVILVEYASASLLKHKIRLWIPNLNVRT